MHKILQGILSVKKNLNQESLHNRVPSMYRNAWQKTISSETK